MKFSSAGSFFDIDINNLYIAGWTGRDQKAVQHHIDELAAIGISPPSKTPLYYRVSSTLLTQHNKIEVLGGNTSGEIEPLLIQHQGKRWIGLASDHTDREFEAQSVAASKQICPKPAAKDLWPLDEVEDHLDSLLLECKILEQDEWVTYQEGTLSSILPIHQLIDESGFGNQSAMLCGTLAAHGGIRPANHYQMSLKDPIRQSKIELHYSVINLPVIA